MSREIDPTTLPDQPNKWGTNHSGFQQRWLPGAFGDRTTIVGVYAYKVDEDTWHADEHGIWRTITKAHVVDT